MTPSSLIEKYPMVRLVTYLIDLFDPYGVEHSARVGELSIKIATCMGIKDSDELEAIEMGALLHDIGKLGIPEYLRTKPGILTEAEYFLMKQHSVIGVNILEKMNGRLHKNVIGYVRHHHENYDGTGYPDRLKGNDIPVGARIIRVADSFDAITHTRGYKFPLHPEAALILLDKESVLYDPEVYACFLATVDRK